MDRDMGKLMQGFDDMKENLRKQDLMLERISTKLDYTNGKVRNHDFWIKAVKWGAGIVGTIIILVFPFALDYFVDRISSEVESTVTEAVDDSIERRIRDVLSTYEFDSIE